MTIIVLLIALISVTGLSIGFNLFIDSWNNVAQRKIEWLVLLPPIILGSYWGLYILISIYRGWVHFLNGVYSNYWKLHHPILYFFESSIMWWIIFISAILIFIAEFIYVLIKGPKQKKMRYETQLVNEKKRFEAQCIRKKQLHNAERIILTKSKLISNFSNHDFFSFYKFLSKRLLFKEQSNACNYKYRWKYYSATESEKGKLQDIYCELLKLLPNEKNNFSGLKIMLDNDIPYYYFYDGTSDDIQYLISADKLAEKCGYYSLVPYGVDKFQRPKGLKIILNSKMLYSKSNGDLRDLKYLEHQIPTGFKNYDLLKNSLSDKKLIAIERGHLVGWQFSGYDELDNLVPQTAYLNSGKLPYKNIKFDSNNPETMTYYEIRLKWWLQENPDKHLYYTVTPLYEKNNLVPTSIELKFNEAVLKYNKTTHKWNDEKIDLIPLKLPKTNGSLKEKIILKNYSPWFDYNYETGEIDLQTLLPEANSWAEKIREQASLEKKYRTV
ncbi:hypothetical protein EFE32_06880 [Lactococcus lactis subsp. lactis]|uniref:DNA/RNA non-specific endonuclease n=1 Tax=Lactococcus lactis TaxID=1358 RepID=UPI00223B8869|nr:DNA/RNA non-specific endonuclease [Lactococcus lactis]MCT0016567.1 hypothetical protein [Lactococcus lactis subsp. lactis]